MAKITAAMGKELRETTGAGMMDCKKALTATDGDKEKAIDWLREKGISKAEKKAGRIDFNSSVCRWWFLLQKMMSGFFLKEEGLTENYLEWQIENV